MISLIRFSSVPWGVSLGPLAAREVHHNLLRARARIILAFCCGSHAQLNHNWPEGSVSATGGVVSVMGVASFLTCVCVMLRPRLSMDCNGSHYTGSPRRTHHEIEWIFATTFDAIEGYHYRGNTTAERSNLLVILMAETRDGNSPTSESQRDDRNAGADPFRRARNDRRDHGDLVL